MQQRTLENGWVLTWAWQPVEKRWYYLLWDRDPSLPNRKHLSQGWDESAVISDARAIHSNGEGLHEVPEGKAVG